LERLREIEDPQEMDALLLPIASSLGSLPSVRLQKDSTYYLRQGQPVRVDHAPKDGWVQIFECAEEDRFLGVGEVLTDGRIAPRRLVAGE